MSKAVHPSLTDILASKAVIFASLLRFRCTADGKIVLFNHSRDHAVPITTNACDDRVRLPKAAGDRIVRRRTVGHVMVRRKIDHVIAHEGVKVVGKDGIAEVG